MVRYKKTLLAITCFSALGLIYVPGVAWGAGYELVLRADEDSRWYDLISAAWVEVGQGWNGNPDLDGFFSIEREAGFGGGSYDSNTFDPSTFNPQVYSTFGGVDSFPNESDFTVGNYRVDYDASGE